MDDKEIQPIREEEPPLLCLAADPTPKGYICGISGEVCDNELCEWWSCRRWLDKYRVQ